MVSADRADLKSDEKRKRLTVSMFEMAPDAMLVIDSYCNVSIANSKAEELFQWSDFPQAFVKIESLFPEWENIMSEIYSSNEEPEEQVAKLITTVATKGGGSEFVAEIEPSLIVLDEEDYIGLVVRDVTKSHLERRQLETTFQHLQNEKSRLESLVKQDALTQLFNRRGLESILSREIEFARRNNSSLLAAIVDLDNFKMVNDNFGHFTGDIVLRHVAGILKRTVRAVDWVGRVGGDEFLILLPGTSLSKGALVAERVRLELNRNSIMTSDGTIHQTASFGLVALPLSVCSIEEVLELTKGVLKESKHKGKNCVSTGGLSVAQPDGLTGDLRGELDGYRSVSEPIVDLCSREIVGYQLRICGPDGSEGLTDDLLRRSRQNDTGALLDLQCLQIALGASRSVAEKKACHLNLCSSTLVDIPVANLLERIHESIDDREICIELSAKTLPPNPQCLLDPIQQLKNQGIKVCLTDVGFGKSSLEFLLYVQPDYIRLHRSLTLSVGSNDEDQKFIRLLLQVLSPMSIQIVADGIETETDLGVLKDLGVRYGQGSMLR